MLAARKLDADGVPADLPAVDWHLHHDALQAALGNDATRYGDIARHHFAYGSAKPVRPGAQTTCGEAADALIAPGANQADIERAYAIQPAHPLIALALAAFQKNPARTAFLRDHGLERLPANPAPELQTRADALRRALG